MTPHEAMASWDAAVAAAREAWVPFLAASVAHDKASWEYYDTPRGDDRSGRHATMCAAQRVAADAFVVYDYTCHAATGARERAAEAYVAAGLLASVSSLLSLFPRTLDDYNPDLEGALTALLLAPVRS